MRVEGKIAEIWHADTGLAEPASYVTSYGRTKVHLNLAAEDAVFVVFRKPSTQAVIRVPAKTEKQLAILPEAWSVLFQPGRGAPEKISVDHLASWSTSADHGVKYFPGHATYTQSVVVPTSWIGTKEALWLDLGDVADLAVVSVNGKSMGRYGRSPTGSI